MIGIAILLIVIGLIFIIISCTNLIKAEEKNAQTGEGEISPEEMDAIKQKISQDIDEYVATNVDGKMDDIEAKLAEIVNQKTLALGDYAVTVNEEIERNHNEVMFLYTMLSDKQKEIMTTAGMVDDYRKDVEAFVNANTFVSQPTEEDTLFDEEIKDIDEQILEEQEEEKPLDSSTDVILEMHKSGLSILEIAKHLGLGVGEVKLVVDLYQGGSKK